MIMDKTSWQSNGRKRVVIENVEPEIDAGRFSIKRVVGEEVSVSADIFCDGHDQVSASLLYRKSQDKKWTEVAMTHAGNDVWRAGFVIEEKTDYSFTIKAWVNHFGSWCNDLLKKFGAGQDIQVELQMGIALMEGTLARASKESAQKISEFISAFKREKEIAKKIAIALSPDLKRLMRAYPIDEKISSYDRELKIIVDDNKALFSAWYEMFPRSCSEEPKRPGNFNDCKKQLPQLAEMGFDVLYFPPIHPIGKSKRKGKDNATVARPEDPGSPWAIGSSEGGHKSIDSSLGSFKDFEELVNEAKKYNIELALDLAFQCSLDHPYLEQHPQWFKKRPDGSIQHAENPPKKYEDIIPFDFESEGWQELWQELKSIVVFWIEKGVRLFRVDNPHTKPFAFWEWLITQVKKEYPNVLFLSEAFTRPKVMYRLAKLGFSQSYTYFTWRNTKWELTQYLSELTSTELRDFFRPNFWTNTPDILPEFLQYGGRPAFVIRLILAATLSSNYGVFGPAFELCVKEALPGQEEYKSSEKYEIKHWDRSLPGNLVELMARLNKMRRENKALQIPWNLRFHEVDNEYLLFYSKTTPDLENIILVVVNLDPFHKQSGWIKVPVQQLGIEPQKSYLAHDLIGGDKYIWQGEKNYVELNPAIIPAHVLKIYRRARRESDFDYFM
jgi:starch synthase (maltosyl-transferring)